VITVSPSCARNPKSSLGVRSRFPRHGEFVAYYRVSTERQRVSGPELEAQREAGVIRPLIAKYAMNRA